MDKIKKIIPEFILKTLRNLRSEYFSYTNKRMPYLNKIKYCGYYLYYTRGQGLIDRIRFGSPNRIYEEDLSKKIVSLLKDKENPFFIDIGSNIGLISTYVLSKVKNCKILAFEPGPHQQKLFAITIFANQLEENISLFAKALSDKTGTITFNVHKDIEHCGGDGILSTNRGGETTEIKVESTKFDDFVKDHAIHITDSCLIKIDTEGAEFLVLKGAEDFILKYKPTIIFEMTNLNMHSYNHTAKDMLDLLTRLNYSVKTLDEKTSMKSDNIDNLMTETDSFIAIPNKN